MRLQSNLGVSIFSFLVRIASAGIIFLGMITPTRAALDTIQEQIDAALPGSTVIVAAGTYTESLVINKNLTLEGVSATSTILAPPAGHRGILIQGSPNPVTITLRNLTISGASITGEVGGGVKVENGTLSLDNCRIMGNSADYGGGVYLDQGSLTIFASTIQGNHASVDGGGIYSKGPLTVTVSFVGENTAGRHGGGAHGQMGLVSLEGSYFEDNSAVQNGGGLNMNDELTISASSFISNTAGADGGGVLQWNKLKTITLSHTTFSYNTAARTGGGMAAKGELSVDGGLFYKNTAGDAASSQDVYGGGLYLEGGGLSLHGTTFQENKTVCHYCFFSEGGGLAVRNGVSNLVTDAIFQGNSSWFGGGLAQGKLPSDPIYGSLTVLRSTFRNNTGGYGGGLDGINVTVNDSLFEGNSVVNNGGGLEISGDSQLDRVRVLQNWTTAVQSKGAGISITASATILNSVFNENIHQSTNSGAVGPGIFINPNAGAVTLKQVTISHNTGGNGSGLQVDGGSATLANVILTRQVLGVCVKAGSAALDGVLWYSNTSNSGSAPDCPLTPTVSHAVTGDPAFAPDGYHITGGSAAFNAGLVSGVPDDLDGDSRPQFGLYDLGADELVYRVNLPMIKK